jgi:hypothetical protein
MVALGRKAKSVPNPIRRPRRFSWRAKRTVKAVAVAAGLAFPHAAQAIQITRKTRRNGSRKWRTETSYAITSLPTAQVRPRHLAERTRGNWKIEINWYRSP